MEQLLKQLVDGQAQILNKLDAQEKRMIQMNKRLINVEKKLGTNPRGRPKKTPTIEVKEPLASPLTDSCVDYDLGRKFFENLKRDSMNHRAVQGWIVPRNTDEETCPTTCMRFFSFLRHFFKTPQNACFYWKGTTFYLHAGDHAWSSVSQKKFWEVIRNFTWNAYNHILREQNTPFFETAAEVNEEYGCPFNKGRFESIMLNNIATLRRGYESRV